MAQGRMEQWLAGAPGPHGIRLAHACESEMCARQRSRKVCPVAAAASQSGSGALCALRNARMAVVKCSTAARASPARARAQASPSRRVRAPLGAHAGAGRSADGGCCPRACTPGHRGATGRQEAGATQAAAAMLGCSHHTGGSQAGLANAAQRRRRARVQRPPVCIAGRMLAISLCLTMSA